ncbi:7,8-dihydropterin-6-yl-methyl-4-(beta-D-ribofuranosyl)aminobenzene 5'-phosphate synthase [Clostridium punense]|uniref:7, 8-dihydropterin-6-yl-methyl-4-(Beta-D-ribofuranosyl)aminobenzene 5'-phosphate synthase n=1 Tax=Clostridium punense TaxID=1054297 RepID=A0ABS4K2L8_9CLOT|nr:MULTISPECIES: MBL fold metallo-hydrolase [Clostridium]MBP2022030.1 7,8-dihydropterin-6-yl-methyl-4-(beta-D-ribofuranosyl)aminobenzene 5'-phosphate synthase [Clostridium punense]
MKVITLFENRSISKEYKSSHGLSLYIETKNHKILFDTGTDDSFVYNASKLGVNLEDVDIAIISHGHNDHGGGLEAFLRINSRAKIYVGKGAFDDYLTKLLGIIKFNIGLKKELISDRFEFVDGVVSVDDELIVFNNIEGNKLLPKGNDRLLKKYSDGTIKRDDFAHEINLLINENNKYSLFCGCSHRGIVNIIEKAKTVANTKISTVIGGFHLMGMKVNSSKNTAYFQELADSLNNSGVDKYYTCHCTGEEAYNHLRKNVETLDEVKTGMVVEI